MLKNVRTFVRSTFVRSALGLAFIVLAAGSNAVFAQNTLEGNWTASIDGEKPDKIYLSFERRTERGHKSQMGSNYDYTDLQGLRREQATAGGAVRFSLVREAGTIECEGAFRDGKGSGTFRFTGSQAFISAMKGRGFDFEQTTSTSNHGRDSENRLFAATTLNVTTALADDLTSSGFVGTDVDDLFKAAIFKIDSQFAREMKESGFPGLGMEELVKARIFKIDADFVRQAAQMGFDKEPFESLIKMRIFKVTPEFIDEVRGEGLRDLSVEELVKMRIFKIDGQFIRRAKAEGVPLDVEELVQKRIGVRGR